MLWIGFLVIPTGVCLVFPQAFRYVVGGGVVLASVEWTFAYRSSQVEHGGDWQAGSELFAFTGFFALFFFGIWVCLAFVGLTIGRVRRHRRNRSESLR